MNALQTRNRGKRSSKRKAAAKVVVSVSDPEAEAGRSISRGEHEELIEALRARMATAEAKALYRLRSQRVELVNADGKQHRKLRRFSGRGLTPVRCQVGLVVLAHNLVTLLSEEQKARAADVNPPVIAT